MYTIILSFPNIRKNRWRNESISLTIEKSVNLLARISQTVTKQYTQTRLFNESNSWERI